MKRCPACNRTYTDDTQMFCLQDGTPLVADAPYTAQAAPPPPQPQPQPQPTPQPSWGATPPPPPPAPPKRKMWPWVLGGVLVLFFGGLLLLGVLGYVFYRMADTNNATGVRSNTNTNTNTAAEDVGPPVNTANTELYVNARDEATGSLAANYVDFSFRYPKTWKLDPDPAPSFVRVERANAAGNTIENFSVGWFAVTGGGSGAGNTALLSQTINNLSNQVSGNFPNYTKVGEGATTVGRYNGYELRFSGATQPGNKGLPYWGRIIIIPDPNGGRNGVSLIMLTTGHSKDVKGQPDVGEKGELPVILKTFRIGPTPGATSSTSTNANTDDEEEQ